MGRAGVAAAQAVGEAVDAYRMAAWQAYVARRPSEPREWQTAALSTDMVGWLTAAELRDLTQGLLDLVAPYARRSSDEMLPAGGIACRPALRLRLPGRPDAPPGDPRANP